MSEATISRKELHNLSPTERCMGLFTTLRPGEGRGVVLFFVYAFLLLICYYILKTIREPLLLTEGSAELKSYAYAAIALVLLVMVPLYGALFRRTQKRRLVRRVTMFFVLTLALFFALGRVGLDVGFVYYVWVGVFGVTVIAQFWAHAAHTYRTESGQRLFPVIMAGAALGALAGPPLSGALYQALGVWNLMAIAMALLVATLPFVQWTWAAVPADSRNGPRPAEAANLSGGFAIVMRDPYLQLLALLAVLLNCVNTTGEYILTTLVIDYANQQAAEQAGIEKGDVIAAFYGHYYFAVNAFSVIFQVCLVARIFRCIGVQGALLVLPIIALIGYGVVLFVPIFSIIRAVKILENSADYSIMNTARQALYLPLPAAHQYQGKTAIDTFFWRLGDVLQAGVIYVGVNWLDFGFQQFAMLNMVLALLWIALAIRIGKRYGEAAPRRVGIDRKAVTGFATAAFGALAVAAFALPVDSAAEPVRLFTDHEPLEVELLLDLRALCRKPRSKDCADSPATLSYRSADGTQRSIRTTVRARGKWRNESGNCRVPPLFVSFHEGAAGTIFEGQELVPLTTHCRDKPSSYEQYLLKEYLAYRIYNLLTDKSLRVRLVRIAYLDPRGRGRSLVRYAFFTEHFKSLAARHGTELWTVEQTGPFNLQQANPRELATFDLFQYLIGNTDWSAIAGHNVTHLRHPSGHVTAVPYDFDFSGLVNAAYAGPSEKLPIRRVTQRLFRGFCQSEMDWAAVFAELQSRRVAIDELVEQVPGLEAAQRGQARAYLAAFFEIINSTKERQARIVGACRTTSS